MSHGVPATTGETSANVDQVAWAAAFKRAHQAVDKRYPTTREEMVPWIRDFRATTDELIRLSSVNPELMAICREYVELTVIMEQFVGSSF